MCSLSVKPKLNEHMKKQTKLDTTSTAAAAAPKGKDSLIGRGALIRQLAAENTPLALFISAVRAKYPVCGTAWCEKHYKRAMARIAKRAAAAAPAPAPAPVETQKPKGKKKSAKA
jgi:hypothetical protein